MPDRPRLIGMCLAYAAVMLYSSTIIGPSGLNFVHRDPVEAFRAFLATHYVAHGSDQRADWVGNLLMLVPFGFLVTGAVWPRRAWFRVPSAIAAILLCVGVILIIKYLQLFFPPRTVTLNYILAQSLGAMVGCAIWVFSSGWGGTHDPVGALVVVLRLYAVALVLFVLMPLDFALDAADLQAQLDRLPDAVLALPGSGRPLVVRAILIGVGAAAFVPVGMLLSFIHDGRYRVGRSLVAVAARGLLMSVGLFGLTALVISAYPTVVAIIYRSLGILAGATAMRWLVRQDPSALWLCLRRLVPWTVPPYLLVVLLMNRLLSTHWLSPAAAIAQAYRPGLLPLFDYYIVSKAEAAKNIIGHLALYAPIGVLLRLRFDGAGPGTAFCLAAALSLFVELARYLRPELAGDINAVVVAGLAAALSARLTPAIWSMVGALRRPQTERAGRSPDEGLRHP